MRVGVVGATGYVGSELVRWISAHPELELVRVMSRSSAGRPLVDLVPSLLGFVDLTLAPLDATDDLDVVFLATPHRAAAPLVDGLAHVRHVVDCSRDHRHVDGWVYGQPEWNAEALRGAHRIAAPGCFATALGLGLAPLAAAGIPTGPAMITAATGSTGSGAAASAGTHHPLRFANLKAYKVLRHQHEPEVAAFLGGLGTAPALHFVPLSAPVDRGILASILVSVDGDARAAVNDAYATAPLVRLRPGSPELRWVRGTAFADVTVTQRDDVASVLVAIDNLGKGAAAQAVQALNLSLGFPADLGLRAAPATP